jgi:hypothetical protein
LQFAPKVTLFERFVVVRFALRRTKSKLEQKLIERFIGGKSDVQAHLCSSKSFFVGGFRRCGADQRHHNQQRLLPAEEVTVNHAEQICQRCIRKVARYATRAF